MWNTDDDDDGLYARVCVCVCASTCAFSPAFRAMVPNGLHVPCPDGVEGCSKNGLCEGIGHGSCQARQHQLTQRVTHSHSFLSLCVAMLMCTSVYTNAVSRV